MDTAYANIGLDANTIWRDAPGDGFQKSSDKLWVKLNYLKEKKHHQVGEKGKVVTVHDVIPQSKLAVYGNYSYDNDREMMYNREKPLLFSDEINPKTNGELSEEPWMMVEVEQEFKRLTRNCSQPYDLYNGFKPIDCVEVEESIQKKYPVLAKKCQPHTIDTKETLEAIYLPNPFYRIDDLNQLELQMRITSTKHIWEHPLRNLMSLINSEKYSEQLRCPTFPEVDYPPEKGTQPQLFPLPLIPTSSPSPPSHPPFLSSSSFRLIESLGDLNVRRTMKTPSRTSQLAEGNIDPVLPILKKRSSAEHHHDFTNLTLLTRPINRQESRPPEQSSFQVPETVLKWLQTGYPTRSREFSAIQNLSEELRNVRTGLQGSSSSNFARDKFFEENVGVRRNEPNPTLETQPSYRSENFSASLSSSSSSEQNRPKLSRSGTKLQISPVSNFSCSAVSSGSLAGSWQSQNLPLWSSKPFNILGLGPSSEVGFPRDNAFQRPAGKPGKCRPILNSHRREGAADEETPGFEGAAPGKKKPGTRGATDMRFFQCYGETSFDDLERQAIEQWPSEDRMDIFCSKHLQ